MKDNLCYHSKREVKLSKYDHIGSRSLSLSNLAIATLLLHDD